MTEALKKIEKDMEEAQRLVEEAVDKELSKRIYQKRLKVLTELFWARERIMNKENEK